MRNMKAYARLPLVIGLAAALGIAGLVLAQSKSKSDEQKGQQSGMMMGQQNMGEMQKGMQQQGMMDPETMMQHRAKMMENSGMSKDQVEQWKARMSVKVRPDSPAGLLGFEKALDLTSDQVQQLKKIEDEASQKAMGVLTDSQKASFEKMKYEPSNVMEMSMHMGRDAMGQMKQGSSMREGWGGKNMMKEGEQMKEGWGKKK